MQNEILKKVSPLIDKGIIDPHQKYAVAEKIKTLMADGGGAVDAYLQTLDPAHKPVSKSDDSSFQSDEAPKSKKSSLKSKISRKKTK